MERTSVVFLSIAKGRRAGAELIDAINASVEKGVGHLGTGVQKQTVLRWAAAGWVIVQRTTGRKRSIVSAKLTAAGVAACKAKAAAIKAAA